MTESIQSWPQAFAAVGIVATFAAIIITALIVTSR
jgi:hypothetical protein